MPQPKPDARAPSIGDVYRRIRVTPEDFSGGEGRLTKEPDPFFVGLCKRLSRIMPSLGRSGKFTRKNQDAIDFLKWRLSAQEFAAASTIFLLLVFAAAFALAIIAISIPFIENLITLIGGTEIGGYAVAFLPPIIIAAFASNFFSTYPETAARREQTRALTYVPEILGYMVMSIKLVPNLEKAVEFSAEHGKGKIARDFKDLIWAVQLGTFNSLSEGLDALAYQWGKYSDEFKRALMRIRASVIENSESKRYAMLDATVSEMLESIRNKMEKYARELSQPSTMLFYIGVLLPLLLIIILPVGSSFSGAPLANPLVLFAIYNIAIPLVTIAFAYNLIQSRPPTYEPPVIPDSYEGLPRKWRANIRGISIDCRLAAALVLIVGLSASYIISTEGIPPKFAWDTFGIKDKTKQFIQPDLSKEEALKRAGRPATFFALDETGRRYAEVYSQLSRGAGEGESASVAERAKVQVLSEEQLFFSEAENDVAPYRLVFGVLIAFSLAVFIVLYYSNIYKRRVQEEVQAMESEFKDTLYILASRMGENKPVEDAIKHVTEFLPDLKISQRVFAKTLDNINLAGMPLEQAVFDEYNGSVAKIPSTIIKGSMKMLVDSVQLGVNVAARTLISLSIQLQNSEKVNSQLKILVSDVTGTMKTMTLFIAPIVLGITTSLQRIVIVTISSIAASNVVSGSSASGAESSFGSGFSNFASSGFIKPESIANIATPTQFILIVALYIVELVLIMTYFTTKIEEDNDLMVKINIATYLPIAVIMFVISMIVSNALVGSI